MSEKYKTTAEQELQRANSATSNPMALTSLFVCSACFEYAMPPIMQCSDGHLLCSACHQKLTMCPVCRISLTNIRNLSMEKVASKLNFPCKHFLYGCRKCLFYSEKKIHEDDCDFRPYFCPYPDENCVWHGPLSDVYNHLLTTHQNVISMEGHEITFLATNNNSGAIGWNMIQSCYGRHFFLSLEKIHLGEGYFANCRLIGSIIDAAKFKYTISLKADNRILKCQSQTHSIRENLQAFTSADFLALDKTKVELFSEDGSLALNVVIRPVDDIEQEDI